jgi:hypothetical protein
MQFNFGVHGLVCWNHEQIVIVSNHNPFKLLILNILHVIIIIIIIIIFLFWKILCIHVGYNLRILHCRHICNCLFIYTIARRICMYVYDLSVYQI